MSSRPIRDRRGARPGRQAPEAAVEEAPPPPPPASNEEAMKKYREEMQASAAEYDKVVAESGGRRDEIRPAPTPEEFAKLEAERATRPPRVLTDEEMGIGELGIPERRLRGIGAAWNFT